MVRYRPRCGGRFHRIIIGGAPEWLSRWLRRRLFDTHYSGYDDPGQWNLHRDYWRGHDFSPAGPNPRAWEWSFFCYSFSSLHFPTVLRRTVPNSGPDGVRILPLYSWHEVISEPLPSYL